MLNFHNLTVGQIITFITSLGVICAFFYKIFNILHEIKNTKKSVERAHSRIDGIELNHESEKNKLLEKLEETNIAVNLICKAVSALINCKLSHEDDISELTRVKQELDDKKGII